MELVSRSSGSPKRSRWKLTPRKADASGIFESSRHRGWLSIASRGDQAQSRILIAFTGAKYQAQLDVTSDSFTSISSRSVSPVQSCWTRSTCPS